MIELKIKRWTEEEVNLLIEMRKQNYTLNQIANKIGKTQQAVSEKIRRINRKASKNA